MNKMRNWTGHSFAIGLLLLAIAFDVTADDILVINGTSTTNESGTTAGITANLQSLLESQGNTVTVSDPVPADISGYDQVWDIRFFPALSAGEETQFVNYLAAGGNAFVMGENDFFGSRNTSVISLIEAAGGGSLSYVAPDSTQSVHESFRTPNNIETVTYCVPGGVSGAGTTAGNGIFLSSDGAVGGSALGFGQGTLANASSGSLAVVFDVNFMDRCGANNQLFLENLTSFVLEGGVTPPPRAEAIPVPTLSTWALILMALMLALVSTRFTRARH